VSSGFLDASQRRQAPGQPAVAHAGWDVLMQIREEVAFTAGKIMVKGKTVKRGTREDPAVFRWG
jgi:hypothetical protein